MAEPQQQQIQIRVDESKMHTTYANTIRTSTTMDEVVLDFGLNIPQQMSPNEPPIMAFGVGARVVMNWAGAKRLAMSLGQAVQQYEQNVGEIDLNPPNRAKPR
ncbi:MAG: DUF3467 domain-containing protein [Phycisphaerales bacterium]|nr:DUF3467 domain-containing protein [Phycisphaerales bacterium]